MGVHVFQSGMDILDCDADTAQWRVRLDGWDSETGSTLVVTQRPRGNGGIPSQPFQVPKDMVLTGSVQVNRPDQLEDALDRLALALPVEAPSTVTITRYGRARSMVVYRQGKIDVVRYPSPYIATFTAQLLAPDGRRFGAPLTSSTGLPSVTGGLRLPLRLPFTLGSTVVSGQVVLTNPGKARGPVIVRIDGPCPPPTVTHQTSGLQLIFSSSLWLGVSEFLLIDMENKVALANGQETRAAWITSRGWSGFDRGTNVWAFSAAGYDPAALMTVTATPAW